MTTYTPKLKDQQLKKWYLIDAEGKPLGRLASHIARILRGKNKPSYTPFLDMGDHVVVINAEKVKLTGNKVEQKTYFSHSGYPGGAKIQPISKVLETHPDRIITHAVKGMMPKNRLGRKLMKKLRVFKGDQHDHQAQKPEKLDF